MRLRARLSAACLASVFPRFPFLLFFTQEILDVEFLVYLGILYVDVVTYF